MNSQTLSPPSALASEIGVDPRYLLSSAAAITGGMMIIAGSMMPWMTLFAGLHAYNGIIGLNGKLLLAGGVLSILTGLALMLLGGRLLNRVAGGLGVALLGFTAWLLVRQYQMYQELASGHPMTVPGVGNGLYVAAAGALLVTLTMLIGSVRAGKR